MFGFFFLPSRSRGRRKEGLQREAMQTLQQSCNILQGKTEAGRRYCKMNKIVLGADEIKFISMFESMTHSQIRDCIIKENEIIFIVAEGEIGKAVGKGGRNIKQLDKLLKKRVKVVEYSTDLIRFINSLVSPLKLQEVALEGDTVFLVPSDNVTRGLLIGRGAVNLRGFEAIAKRYFPIKEIRVV